MVWIEDEIGNDAVFPSTQGKSSMMMFDAISYIQASMFYNRNSFSQEFFEDNSVYFF